MSAEGEVRNASAQFYAALNRVLDGDAESLADIWSQSAIASAMHPIGGCQAGWDKVRESFEKAAQLTSGGHVELRDQRLWVSGGLAYEVGVEHGQAKLAGEPVTLEQRVTNIYRSEPGTGGWKIIHHHADLSTEMLSILSRVQAA